MDYLDYWGNPKTRVIFCLPCKREGRRWIWTNRETCPHTWQSAKDIRELITRVLRGE